jgi:gamma-glutamyltranspeptidase/glutathione hydrolase
VSRLWGVIWCLVLLAPNVGCGPTATEQPRRRAQVTPRQMVVSAHPAATRAALETLRRGGNATDAAVVAAFVLAVVEPYSSGLGGGGFALSYDVKTTRVASLDFRERAPLKAHAKMYLDPALRGKKPSRIGALAVGTPGMVAGMAALVKRSGSWPWKRLLEPARRLAQNGFPVFPLYRRATTREQAVLRRFPHAAGIFLPGGGVPPLGPLIKQPDLARTLSRLGDHGPTEFYRGETARLIAAEMQRQRGILSTQDLRAYRVRWSVPVRGRYRGYDV